jgi:hypothetical protein
LENASDEWVGGKMEGGFPGLLAVGDEAGEQVDDEIERTAMTCVFDLTHILELIDDGLDEGALAWEQPVGEVETLIAHVFAQFGDEAQPLLKEEPLSQWG